MVNQTTLNSDTSVSNIITDTPLAGVLIDVKDDEGTQVVSDLETTSEGNVYTAIIPGESLSSVGTFTIIWKYALDEDHDKTVRTFVDVLEDTMVRYCYQSDVREKLFDIDLPASFNLGNYTNRASNEIEQHLQGLYELPLTPDPDHDNYRRDALALRELCSDIAVSYAIEDISISTRRTEGFNLKKQAAFAELNRYASAKKVFASVPKDDSKEDIAYQKSKPRASAAPYEDGQGNRVSDPFDSIYNNFTPR